MRRHVCLLAGLAALPLGAAEAEGATPYPVVVEEPAATPPAVAAQPQPAGEAAEPWSRPWNVDLRLLLSGAAPIDEVETGIGFSRPFASSLHHSPTSNSSSSAMTPARKPTSTLWAKTFCA